MINGMKPESRPRKARNRIYASELGYPMLDRYHKMLATPTNTDFSSRTFHKFFLGDLVEYGYIRIWERAGITVETQKGGEKLIVQVDGALPVSGKYDAILSAVGDWDRYLWEIENNPLPEHENFIDRYAKAILLYCKAEYPDGFKREIFEMKTINSQVFRARMKSGTIKESYFYHHLQCYTYMKALGSDRGNILYISKDDGLFHIEKVEKSPELDALWLKDVMTITDHINNRKEPEPEPLYKMIGKRYQVNWGAVGSNYLHLFSDKDKDELQYETKKIVNNLNAKIRREEKALAKEQLDPKQEVKKINEKIEKEIKALKNEGKK